MGEVRRWMIELREARFASIQDAAGMAKVSVGQLYLVEDGSETAPGVAKRIGAAYGMSKAQIGAITCQASVERRKREAAMSREERIRDRLQEIY